LSHFLYLHWTRVRFAAMLPYYTVADRLSVIFIELVLFDSLKEKKHIIRCFSKLYPKYWNSKVMSMVLVLRLWHLYDLPVFKFRMSALIRSQSCSWLSLGCGVFIWLSFAFPLCRMWHWLCPPRLWHTGNCFGFSSCRYDILGGSLYTYSITPRKAVESFIAVSNFAAVVLYIVSCLLMLPHLFSRQ
jgi:hypothetical protein